MALFSSSDPRWPTRAGLLSALRTILTVALACSALPAQADDTAAPLRELVLDINSDGISDHAVLLKGKDGNVDLAIKLGHRNGAPPKVIAHNIARSAPSLELRATAKGALVVTSGCGGCSNDIETSLTLVYRRDTLLVAGVTLDWDTRTSSGHCDINLLTGHGMITRDQRKQRTVRVAPAAIKAQDWREDAAPKVCRDAAR